MSSKLKLQGLRDVCCMMTGSVVLTWATKGNSEQLILAEVHTTALFALKGLFHPAFLAHVVSWFPFVVAIFMGHENGGKQRLAKR